MTTFLVDGRSDCNCYHLRLALTQHLVSDALSSSFIGLALSPSQMHWPSPTFVPEAVQFWVWTFWCPTLLVWGFEMWFQEGQTFICLVTASL